MTGNSRDYPVLVSSVTMSIIILSGGCGGVGVRIYKKEMLCLPGGDGVSFYVPRF